MDIWEILGIQPTNDEKDIRRAYARQLKIYRPDTHPEEYQHLREAFESAKNYASYSAYFKDEESCEENTVNYLSDDAIYSEYDPEDIEPGIVIPGSVCELTNALPAEIPAIESPYTQEQLDEITCHIINAEQGWKQEVSELWMHVTEQGSLHVIQQFHTDLAWALAQCEGLTESPVEYLSNLLGWRLHEYDATNIIPYYTQQALNLQLRNTEVARAWAQYKIDASYGSFGAKKAMQYLVGKQEKIPLWLRLVPNFITEMTQKFENITNSYPEIEERINPTVREFISKKPLSITWNEYLLIAFWGIMLAIHSKSLGINTTVIVLIAITYYILIHNVIMNVFIKNDKSLSLHLIIDFIISSLLILMLLITGLHSMVEISTNNTLHVEYIIIPVIIISIILLFKKTIPYNCPFIRIPGVIIYMIILFPLNLLQKLGGEILTAIPALIMSSLYVAILVSFIKRFLSYIP